MSKIVVMGPLDLLMVTLALIEKMGIMQVDEKENTESSEEFAPLPFLVDKETVLQHQFLEKLKKKIDEILGYFGNEDKDKQSEYKSLAIETLVAVIPTHLTEIKTRSEKIARIQKELEEYETYKLYVDALDQVEDDGYRGDINYIGVQLEKLEDAASLQEYLEKENMGKVSFEIVPVANKKETVGVVVVEKENTEQVRRSLEDRKLILFKAPDGMDDCGFDTQRKSVHTNIRKKKEQLEKHLQGGQQFREKWHGAYLKTRALIESQLSLMNLTASVVKSRFCFFIYGWLPAKDFPLLQTNLEKRFQGKVVVEESELAEKDFSRIPTALHNPAYFVPFELFSRLVPLPPYASFDLTPFIGIFFPVFFGMMLGDIGYGLILITVALYLIKKFAERKNLRDAGKILFISSLYTIVFGILYGELFGTVGHQYLGMQPLIFERHASILPMLCFAIAAGVVHVIVGLVLGVMVSLRRKTKKEAVYKLINIIVILCICVLVISYFTQSITQVQKPLLLTIAVVTPILILVGGIMAPLELLKNIGNIISYARIMAVGLTSVLLAFVANFMAGRIGSIWAGVIVALLLHLFNLLLGVFAPTIHSLRLHYVEFLSKFMEPGGREFKPLGRK